MVKLSTGEKRIGPRPSRNSNIEFFHVVAVTLTLTDDAGDADAVKIMVSRSRTLYSITYSVTVSVTAGSLDLDQMIILTFWSLGLLLNKQIGLE